MNNEIMRIAEFNRGKMHVKVQSARHQILDAKDEYAKNMKQVIQKFFEELTQQLKNDFIINNLLAPLTRPMHCSLGYKKKHTISLDNFDHSLKKMIKYIKLMKEAEESNEINLWVSDTWWTTDEFDNIVVYFRFTF